MKHPLCEPELVACIGLDWADVKHDIGLGAANNDKVASLVLAHQPEAIEQWGQPLRQRFKTVRP